MLKSYVKHQDTHKFPDGMVDDFITFESNKEIIGFSCYIYQDGRIIYRFQIDEKDSSIMADDIIAGLFTLLIMLSLGVSGLL